MKRTVQAVFLSLLAVQVLVVGQGDEARRVLSQVRAALGGEEKVAAVKTVAAEGQLTRTTADGSSVASTFELAFDLPAKFVKKEEFANMNGTSLYRRTGFSGAEVIEEADAPPMMGGGGMHVMRLGPGGPMVGGQATPEQIAAAKKQSLVSSQREFARLTLGMFASSFSAFPVEFKYAGQAEAPEGKADVLDVQGPDGFAAKLFVDGKSHLPLMLSWLDREPLRLTVGPEMAGGDPETLRERMAQRMKELEANRRTVEFRMFYGDYKAFDGVKLPTRIQRMTDGVPTDEITLEKVKINGKIDASKFAVAK